MREERKEDGSDEMFMSAVPCGMVVGPGQATLLFFVGVREGVDRRTFNVPLAGNSSNTQALSEISTSP